MFCGKCGMKIEDIAVFCPYCGNQAPGRSSLGEQPEAPVDRWERTEYLPQNGAELHMADGARMDDGSAETELLGGYGAPNTITTAQTEPQTASVVQQYVPAPPVAPKKKKWPLAVILASVAVLLCLGGFVALRVFYFGSDSYRLNRAGDRILSGEIDEAVSDISDIASAEADAVRQFADVMRHRKAFMEQYKSDKVQMSDDPVKLPYEQLVAAYDGFDAADKLPESLKKRYDKMNGRLTKMSEATKNLTPALLVDAQRGVWAYGERKRGESFTITGIDKVIAVAEPAVNTLKTELVETEGYRDLQAHSQAKGLTMVDEFYHAVATRLAQDKYNVAEYRKQHMGENAELFLSDQEARFTASVGSLLAPVYMQENAEDNAETVYLSLCCAWMAYACEE